MNQYGRSFRLSIMGESHGHMVGIVLDGVPAGLELSVADFEQDLGRRRAGAKGTTPRVEADIPTLATGVFENRTTGAPITIIFENNNTRSKDYSELIKKPRPGHSDFVAREKYGANNDYRGGGHFSGRLTVALVSAGVIAKKLLPEVNIHSELVEAGGSTDIESAIDQAIKDHDSIGGIIETRATGLSLGLGEPFFDSVESLISHLVFAVPATKGVEFGSGFDAARMKGSEHNDNIVDSTGRTETNHAGGINGGITNGNELIHRVAIKPTSSIGKTQKTLNLKTGEVDQLTVVGRHDACIALRAPVVIEAITAIALADLSLQARKISTVLSQKDLAL